MALKRKKRIKKPKTRRQKLVEWVRAFAIATLVLLLIRTFILDFRIIPSSSMEGSIRTGDFVLVSKLGTGARVPFTDGAWRIPGFSDIDRNDVLVFLHPWKDPHQPDRYENLTKRCIGIPGDSLLIRSKQVYLNGNAAVNPALLQFNYWVETRNDSILQGLIDELEITEGGPFRGEGLFRLACGQAQVDRLQESEAVTSVTRVMEEAGKYHDYIFPRDPEFKWNPDHLGPIYVPGEGDSVLLHPKNAILYQRIINEYEDHTLEIKGNEVLIDGSPVSYYQFTQNYYWVMGDNRDLSNDSRVWGFVPESNVIGKVSLVLFSLDRSKPGWFPSIRWSRFFTMVD